MLQAAGYDNPVALMQLAYDVEYRIASFDNSEEATTCETILETPSLQLQPRDCSLGTRATTAVSTQAILNLALFAKRRRPS